MVSAYLIAQIGKNYAVQDGKRITGAAMLKDVVDLLKRIQFDIGGQIVFLRADSLFHPLIAGWLGVLANCVFDAPWRAKGRK